MTSHLHLPTSNNLTNQENPTSRIVGKTTTTNKLQPLRRPALNDLGNRINKLQNDNQTAKATVMGPPVGAAKKKVEVVKKKIDLTTSNKENANIKKENVREASNKVQVKKQVRQESILIPNKTISQAKQNKATDLVKKQLTEQTKDLTIYDPDENTKDDPQMVTEYIEDILAYLRSIENDFPIREKFLEDAKVTPKMRATLVNWMVDAHKNFSLGLEALHLSISIVDRYLQVNKEVDRSIFQLVGISALLLAAKYEEIYIPDISDFVYICDDAFTKRQILQMEFDLCKRLEFRMGWPVSIYFLRRYSKVAQVRSDQHTLAKYMLELALLEYNLAHIMPSIQAAAACCLSISILNEIMDPARVWNPTLVYHTTYKYSDLKPVLHEFAHMIVRAETSKFDSVRQKYSSAKLGKISLNFKLQGPLVRKLTLSPALSRK